MQRHDTDPQPKQKERYTYRIHEMHTHKTKWNTEKKNENKNDRMFPEGERVEYTKLMISTSCALQGSKNGS